MGWAEGGDAPAAGAALVRGVCIRLAGLSLRAEYPNHIIITHFSLHVFSLDYARWCLLRPTPACLKKISNYHEETVKLPDTVSTESHLFLSFLIIQIP